MVTSCIVTPNKKGTNQPSPLFKELLELTQNREATKYIWALSQDSALMNAVGLDSMDEPDAVTLLSKLQGAKSLLGSDGYIKYIEKKEGLDEERFSAFKDAITEVANLKESYPDLVPIIEDMSTIHQSEEEQILKAAPRDKNGRLLAPNGKPSNLTEKQYVQVRTKAFKRWFGDWEYNPKAASKVVDKNGEPLVVYHYTGEQFEVFDKNKVGLNWKKHSFQYGKPAFFFLIAPQQHEGEWGTEEMQCFLNIRNPFYSNIISTGRDHIKDFVTNKKKGIDGLMPMTKSFQKLLNLTPDSPENIKLIERFNKKDELSTYQKSQDSGFYYGEFVVFEPNQIKSATDNNGEFSSQSEYINDSDRSFKITLHESSFENKKQAAKQLSLYTLNQSLISYMEKLGFGVKEDAKLETPGMFSPLQAETNADNLKLAIHIAKTQDGQRALPEEFSHLLISGMRNTPIVSRLLNSLKNVETLESILGESYDQYADKYNNDLDLLAEEAAGRLVAQHLVNRNGLDSDISFISNKALDIIKDNLSKGKESDIDNLIREASELAEEIVNSLESDEDFLTNFDADLVIKSPELYHLENKTRNIAKVAQEAYETMAKRVKIKSLTNIEEKDKKADSKAFHQAKALLEKKKYASSCAHFLSYVTADCTKLSKSLEDARALLSKPEVSNASLRKIFRDIRSVEGAINAYSGVVKTLSTLALNPDIKEELDDSNISTLEGSASDVFDIINRLSKVYQDIRFNSLLRFYRQYWGKDKLVKSIDGTSKTLTLEDILQSNLGDITGFSRLINSMADMSDPLLQLVDIVYKDATNSRDLRLMALQQRLVNLTDKYRKATGSRDTSWMYVKDKNGIPTGMFISNIDYQKFYEERHEYYQRLKDKKLDDASITAKLLAWDRTHKEQVQVSPRRKESMPIQALYKSDALTKLSKAQLDYYNEFMEIKKELDGMLPASRAHLHRAPQKKVNLRDTILDKKQISTALKRYRDQYITDIADTEYGETLLDPKSQHVILDFGGKEVKKVPVYYTTFLDDMSLLDTNASDALMAYGAMANNYSSMMQVANVLEVTNSLMQDRNIVQMSGAKKLFERFKVGGETFGGDYTVPGANTNLAKKLRNYIDSNVYGKYKVKEAVSIKGKEINIGKIGDQLKQYSTMVGLGYNIFSGTTNITMGVAQTLLQAVGGEYFRLKDVLRAHIIYNSHLPQNFLESYNEIKKDKVSLMIQSFDVLEEYYSSLSEGEIGHGIFKKTINKNSPLIFNSMGEHYLHTIAMLAYLNNRKVSLDGKKTSVYEALDSTTDNKGITRLLFKDGSKDDSGEELMTLKMMNELNDLRSKNRDSLSEAESERLSHLNDINSRTSRMMFNIKLNIQDVNHGMHGAFSSVDKGDMHRHVLGRLAAQFRQWMPAFYTARFGAHRYNIKADKEEEGFYRTTAAFVFGTLIDLCRFKFNVLTKWKELSKAEKSNIKKASFEIGLLYLIGFVLRKMGEPDDDDPWYENMLKYNLYRLKMELGAAAPTSLEFPRNIKTLVQSPIPAMENIDRVISLLNFSSMGDTIQSGKYQGWNRWVKNLYLSVPYIRNVDRVVDFVDGDISIFNPYINNKK